MHWPMPSEEKYVTRAFHETFSHIQAPLPVFQIDGQCLFGQ